MKHDEFLRQIASSYVEQYGEQLKEEQKQLEQTAPLVTPTLDRKVKAKIAATQRTRYIRIAGLVAACLVLMLLLPQMLLPVREQMDAPTADAGMGGYDDGEIAYDEMDEMEIAEDEEYEEEYEAPEAAIHMEPESGIVTGGGEMDIIPLSFSLPYGFEVETVEADIGQTIYHLSNVMLDDVVMTLEYAEAGTATLADGMVAVPLGPTVAYAEAQADYNLLALEWGGIQYVLSCKYDINTLLAVGESILI